MNSNETIKENVRQRYGKIALANGETTGHPVSTPCGCNAAGNLNPEQVSSYLGYSATDLKTAPNGANLGLGCGNPGAIAAIQKGETVVDLGSGGGFDCFLAARHTGETGRVIGVDMTSEMILRARKNKTAAGVKNVEFRLGEIEHLPIENSIADLIISNCVINLSTEKDQVFTEAFRVLRPGGRLAISDILALKPLPDHIREDLNLISACIGGAATFQDTRQMLEEAGFKEISITPKPVEPELIESLLPGSRAAAYVTPADILAVKPAANRSRI